MQLPLAAQPAAFGPGRADATDAARAACLSALDRGAASTPLLTRLAALSERAGDLPDAVAAAYAACLARPGDTTRLTDLGALCEQAELWVEALVAYQTVLELSPLHARARRRWWLVQQRIRESGEAQAIVRAAATRIATLLRQGAFPQALGLAAEVEAQLPGAGAADLLRGAIFERQGRYTEAIQAYSDAERFEPMRAHCALERVRDKERRSRQLRAWPIVREIESLLERNEDEAAARAGMRLMNLVPDSPAPYLLWARVAERKGSHGTAIRNLTQALKYATWGCEAITRRLRTLLVAAERPVGQVPVDEWTEAAS